MIARSFCDLRVPAMTGPAFYRQMRAEHPEFVNRIVFMPAHATIDERVGVV